MNINEAQKILNHAGYITEMSAARAAKSDCEEAARLERDMASIDSRRSNYERGKAQSPEMINRSSYIADYKALKRLGDAGKLSDYDNETLRIFVDAGYLEACENDDATLVKKGNGTRTTSSEPRAPRASTKVSSYTTYYDEGIKPGVLKALLIMSGITDKPVFDEEAMSMTFNATPEQAEKAKANLARRYGMEVQSNGPVATGTSAPAASNEPTIEKNIWVDDVEVAEIGLDGESVKYSIDNNGGICLTGTAKNIEHAIKELKNVGCEVKINESTNVFKTAGYFADVEIDG